MRTRKDPRLTASAAPGKLRLAGVASLWLLVFVSAVGHFVFVARWPSESQTQVSPADLVVAVVAVVLASFGGLVVLRGDSRPYGWVMLWTGFVTGVIGLFGLFSLHRFTIGEPSASVAIWIQDLWMLSPLFAVLFLPALFPDGRAASPRWHRLVMLATIGWILLITVFVLSDRPATNFFLDVGSPPPNPTGFLSIPMDVFNLTWGVLMLISIFIGMGSLVTRWRSADLDLRQRFKWMILAFGMLLTVIGLNLLNTGLVEWVGVELGLSSFLEFLAPVALVGLAVSLGFAVMRFRLYDVDLVINRTIVYGILTAVVVLVYIAVVVGAGALLPIDQSLLALVATGVVAVAFTPLRTWFQGWVNSLMFGQRDDPYAVLSAMGRLMTETGAPEETLQTLTETVVTSLKLQGAAIELEQDGTWTTRASFGTVDEIETGAVVVPLRHQEELVGRLVVMSRSPRDRLTLRDLALLEDIAHPAGAIARSVQLTMALQTSRQRLVMAQEEERRRIRRDLHDGLGPSVATQTLQLDEVLELLQDDSTGAVDLVMLIREENQQLVADIRRLVHELRPPTLDELGLAGALDAYVARLKRPGLLSIELLTVPDPLPALPAAVEAAVYRIVREALTNAVRHADATRCVATLEVSANTLLVSVRDNGIGVGRGVHTGVGLISMRERSEELGGSFEVVSPDAGGTEIVATVPLMNGMQGAGISPTATSGARRG